MNVRNAPSRFSCLKCEDNHETADVIGGTGRFAGATGHFELGGLIDFTMLPDFSFVLPWHGTISTVGSTKP